MSPKSCSKCGGRMEPGFIADSDSGVHRIGSWVEGAPVKGMWGGVRIRGKKKLPVTTYRCGRCSYLESYAPEA